MSNALITDRQASVSRHRFQPAAPPEPTNFLPGTAEKLAVFRHRLDAGWLLHHPADRTWGSEADAADIDSPARPRARIAEAT